MITIATVSLPAHLSQGGIDAAIEGMEKATQSDDICFIKDPNKADIVHFHGLWQLGHFQLSRQLRKQKRPYIVSPHGMLEPWAFQNKSWKKKPYFHLIEASHLKQAHSLFVTSEMEKQHVYEKVEHESIAVLPLGCADPKTPDYNSSRKSLNWRNDERILLYLSRIDRKKGLHILLQALANLELKNSNIRLIIVGQCEDAAYQTELNSLEDKLKNQLPKLEWVGPVWGEKRWDYLKGADLFCLPTHSENFGIAVIEALHVGTPVLTTTGTPWASYSENDAFFITEPTIDSVANGLKSALKKNNTSTANRPQLANWTKHHFSWDNLAEKYRSAYAQILHHS